jgi:PAS domain S-box-containing protein
MEFVQYEEAIANYYTSLTFKSLPLLSWNFFAENLDKMKMTLSDSLALKNLVSQNKWKTSWDFKDQLQDNTVIVVTDPSLKIVFASNNIVTMNGYYPKEVIGNSPKMFQGEQTDNTISKEISFAVRNQKPFDKIIINYCKDGSIYKCQIKGYPIFNNRGILTNFIAFEKIAA